MSALTASFFLEVTLNFLASPVMMVLPNIGPDTIGPTGPEIHTPV